MVSQTKSRKIPTRNILPLLFVLQPKAEWLNMDVVEPDKLEWMDELPGITAGYAPRAV